MTYFNIEIQESNGTATAAIYARANKDEAVTNFHTSMASMRAAVDAGTLDGATGAVINSWGGTEQPYVEHYEGNTEPKPNEE